MTPPAKASSSLSSPVSGGGPAPGYAAAIAELDDILLDLERSDVDVDVLAAQVKRAAELISFCRVRINDAKMHIDQVVADLSDD
jgi:exodeoxyribonuclease VII small subunit